MFKIHDPRLQELNDILLNKPGSSRVNIFSKGLQLLVPGDQRTQLFEFGHVDSVLLASNNVVNSSLCDIFAVRMGWRKISFYFSPCRGILKVRCRVAGMATLNFTFKFQRSLKLIKLA